MTLAAPENQEMNGEVEVTCRTLHTLSHSIMVHARVLEAYIHFASIFTTYNIFTVLPIKDMINEDGDPTTPFKLTTGTKPSVSHLCVLFFPCVVQKATVHVGTKILIMRHQAQTGFLGIFVGITQHKKGIKKNIIRIYYIPCTRYVHNISIFMLCNYNEDTAKTFLCLVTHI